MSRFSSTNRSLFLRFGCFFRHLPLLGLLVLLEASAGSLGGMVAWANPQPHLEIHAGLAQVDSLLAENEIQAAHDEILAMYSRFSADGRFGGQIASRVGLTFLRLGQVSEAVPFLEEAIQIDDGPAEYHRNLGFALLELGRRGRALSEYAQAVELDPENFEFRLEYGQLLLEFGACNVMFRFVGFPLFKRELGGQLA